jgi:primase-polymerase (primpol)-like protein
MAARETLEKLSQNNNILDANLRYCFVDSNKLPHTNTSIAKPNNVDDFVPFDTLSVEASNRFAGVGISIQASHICAIDIDHCFAEPFNVESANDIAKRILQVFKLFYCEFSFSGTGIRILFCANPIKDYSKKYYIKNSKMGVEYYYPEGNYRYVTVTGCAIHNNPIKKTPSEHLLMAFLNTFMQRPVREEKFEEPTRLNLNENINYSDLLRFHLLDNLKFQNAWFGRGCGDFPSQSEKDFYMLSFIYNNITKNRENVREIFESSIYFQTKDEKHKYKWFYNNYRYFNFQFNMIK